MTLSGFSYIRNGFEYGYPFLESIQSILSICDEFVIAVGDSKDGTREAIENLKSPKIKIIDTAWDENLRKGGKIFAQQANIAADHISGDWGLHLQADEVIHENDLYKIREAILKYQEDKRVEGLLFKFINFWGNYDYIGTTRRWHRYEVRVIRNLKTIRAYKDSQGFRKYSNAGAYENNEKGEKLRVKKVEVTIYHYNFVRNPELMKKKADYFHRFWHDDDWLKENISREEEFDFDKIDELKLFKGTHPKVMQERIKQQKLEFEYDRSKARFSLKDKILYGIEKLTGWRIGEYKNYKLI